MATTDGRIHRGTLAALPAEDPVQALLRDHDLVRKLAEKYLQSDSSDVKKQAATQLVQAIATQARLEEGVFYPRVRPVDPNLVARLEEDLLAVDDLVLALRGLSMDEPRAEPLVRDLIATVLRHIDNEEKELFPELRRAALDLAPIGLEMQAYEANLVHAQARASEREVRR